MSRVPVNRTELQIQLLSRMFKHGYVWTHAIYDVNFPTSKMTTVCGTYEQPKTVFVTSTRDVKKNYSRLAYEVDCSECMRHPHFDLWCVSNAMV